MRGAGRRLLFVAALALPFAVHGATAQCIERALLDLGWTLHDGPMRVAPGSPCERDGLADARVHGDLHAWLPADDTRGEALRRLLLDPTSGCAFRLRLADATRDAVGALVANERYGFWRIGWRWLAFDRDATAHWRPTHSLGRGYVPATTNSAAIGVFARAGAHAECGVGRQVAQYAGFAALFGDDGFDAAFDRDEIVLGTFAKHAGTRSVLLGSGAGALAGDGLGRDAARRGRAALLASPAFLFAVERRRVVDIANQAQNGVVTEVGATAFDALRDAGSLALANAAALRAWQLSRAIERRGPRWFQRLFGEDDAIAWSLLADDDRAAAQAAREALAHPLLDGISLYGHAHGVKPLRWWVARMLDRNPGTPYRFELANHNLDGEIRERWLAWRLAQCSGGSLTSSRDLLRAPSGPAP